MYSGEIGLRRRLTVPTLLCLLGAAACGADSAGLDPGRCGTGAPLSLGVGQYATLDPTAQSGCTFFSANTSAVDSVEYVVVPQLATGDPDRTATFQLVGDVVRATAAASASTVPPGRGDLPAAERFHAFLRQGDERRAWGLTPAAAPSAVVGARSAAVGLPGIGTARGFSVCAKLDCSRFDSVTATVRALKANIAIYVDTAAPSAGLDSAALDSLATVFQTRLYAVDTAAFGRESDLDLNGVVLVLMTPTVNRLVTKTECGLTGFVTGYFLGVDLDPAFRFDPRSNRGEIFYSMVADPAGAVSCSHTQDQVKRILPVTFIHEFQHMISFNQHVLLRGGDGEALWLNEGLSHFAEELGGWSYGVGTPEFSQYTIGDVHNAYQYLDSPGSHFLLTTVGAGSLAERGAAWLFVRYLADRYAATSTIAGWSAFTRGLLATSLTGTPNIADRTGEPFSRLVTRWALANWVSDLPGGSAPPELRYDAWKFRATYGSLHLQNPADFPRPYPLVPTAGAGGAVSLAGTLAAGSGVYQRVLQGPSAPGFALTFTAGSGGSFDPRLAPRLNVIRVR
jgi:hypothetical protein